MNGAWADGGDVGDPLQQRHVLRMLAEFVVADQRAERRAAERAVFILVDLLEQGTLVELRGPFQVLQQILLGYVEHSDLQLRAGFRLVHQVVQSPPGSLQLLEIRIVHDLVQLEGQQAIDFRDAKIDRLLGVLGHRHAGIEQLADELLQQVAAPVARLVVACTHTLGQDVVQQRRLRRRFRSRALSLGLFFSTHQFTPLWIVQADV